MPFERAVEKYAKCWTEFDSPFRQELAKGDAEKAIRKIAGKYRVARNFPRKFDEAVGIPRYDPVLKKMQCYCSSSNIDPIDAVLRLTRDLEHVYQREVLSASSKFLWFAWGREIIIYDSQALAALQSHAPDLRPKDYRGYCSAWKNLFSECSAAVAAECARQGASNERWFHERVFDWYLWESGTKKRPQLNP